MPIPEHIMFIAENRTSVENDRAHIGMHCPDCDLAMSAKIGPADQADHFIATVIAAHQQQMAEMPALAAKYGQDSIAWLEGTTEFLTGLASDG
jgi:hypothetical protein